MLILAQFHKERESDANNNALRYFPIQWSIQRGIKCLSQFSRKLLFTSKSSRSSAENVLVFRCDRSIILLGTVFKFLVKYADIQQTNKQTYFGKIQDDVVFFLILKGMRRPVHN